MSGHSFVKKTARTPPSPTSLAALLLLQPLRLALSLQIEVVSRLLQQPERGVGLGAVMPPVLVRMDQEDILLNASDAATSPPSPPPFPPSPP